MPDSAASSHTDFASQLPADAYSQLIRTLQLALPPPPGIVTGLLAHASTGERCY